MKKTTRPVFPVPASPISTPRLLLRPISQDDLDDFHTLRTQIEVMKWTSTGIIDASKEATQTWMNGFLPPNDATTFCFAVEEIEAPGKVIGIIGCPRLEPPELSFSFRKETWGKGYAGEALGRWLQAWWELPRRELIIQNDNSVVPLDNSTSERADEAIVVPEILHAHTYAKNAPSARLLSKFGFRIAGEKTVVRDGQDKKVLMLELERPR
ncbi:hypothetical protein ABEF95_007240 [Exophiala dermatitidis]